MMLDRYRVTDQRHREQGEDERPCSSADGEEIPAETHCVCCIERISVRCMSRVIEDATRGMLATVIWRFDGEVLV